MNEELINNNLANTNDNNISNNGSSENISDIIEFEKEKFLNKYFFHIKITFLLFTKFILFNKISYFMINK
jgi:hypothetical protein